MIERKDKIRNKAEVTKVLAKDPSLSQRQTAEKAWVSKTTVHNHMKEIEQNWPESNIMDRILEMDDEIMDLSNQITLKKIIEEAPKDDNWNIDVSKLSLSDVKTIWDLANNSTKRKAIFDKWDKWDPNRNITIQI